MNYFRLPNIPSLTNAIVNILKNNSIKIAKYNINTVGRLFTRLKDPVPVEFKSNVIYSIPCKLCSQIYIGQTSTWLKTRISKHRSDCNLNKQTSALAVHCNNTLHTMDFEDVTIKCVENNYRARLFLEMVYIKMCENTMNFRSDIENLSNIYSYLLYLNKQKKIKPQLQPDVG